MSMIENPTESRREKPESTSSYYYEYNDDDDDDKGDGDEFFDALEDAFSLLTDNDPKQLQKQQERSIDSETENRLNGESDKTNMNGINVDDDVELETEWCFWFDRYKRLL